jgi:hypothetical protein
MGTWIATTGKKGKVEHTGFTQIIKDSMTYH